MVYDTCASLIVNLHVCGSYLVFVIGTCMYKGDAVHTGTHNSETSLCFMTLT